MSNKQLYSRAPSLRSPSRGLFNPESLPEDLIEELFRFLVRNSPAQAVSLRCTSKVLSERMGGALESAPELKKIMAKFRNQHLKASLEEAKEMASRSEGALFTTLWLGSSLAAALGLMVNCEDWSVLSLFPPFLLVYTLAAFYSVRAPDTAKVLRLMFDFSLSYAGNVFVTVQVNSAQSLVALMIAVTSTVHALVLSLLMMSASMQASLWRELDSSLHRAQSVIMLFFYIAITMYYGGIPGVWKLSSACSRIFMLIHFSWTCILPKLSEIDNGNHELVGDNNDGGNGNGVEAADDD